MVHPRRWWAADYPMVHPNTIRRLIRRNARLARDIMGIGFKSADVIAERLGISKTAMIRARAGIAYALMEAVADGHGFLSAAR
jgi:exodeoxyribonuclease V alpha subunit